LWRDFEQTFPQAVTARSRNVAMADALYLMRRKPFPDLPFGLPPNEWSRFHLAQQREVVSRLAGLSLEQKMENTHLGNKVQFHGYFLDAELRAKFIEILWPVYVEHMSKFAWAADHRPDWSSVLEEIFAAVGKPGRGEELASQLGAKRPNDGRYVYEDFPKDNRLMVRRPNLLPPILSAAARPLQSGERKFHVNALHFDGTTLWISVQNPPSGTSTGGNYQDLRFSDHGDAAILWLRPDLESTLDIKRKLAVPSPVTVLFSLQESLWFGTSRHGVARYRLPLRSKQPFPKWIPDLPTPHIGALLAYDGSLLIGGGEENRGHLFTLHHGETGAKILPIPAWDEEISNWRAHEREKNQPGRISLLLRDHGKFFAVSGGNQALLWDEQTGEGVNLLKTILDGPARYGPSGQNGHVLCAVSDAGGWWIGTTAGLARLSPEGKLLRRWSPGRGCYFFNQKNWVPYFRRQGTLRHFFHTDTRLVGMVTALAVDGDFLFVATSTARDDFLPSPVEGSHLFVLHIPTEKWVGRVPLEASATAMAQDSERLWIGTTGSPALVLEFRKKDLTAAPPEQWVEDLPSPVEVAGALAKLSREEQVSHAFFRGDYEQIESLLHGMPLENLSLSELFAIAWSNDALGLNNSEKRSAAREEIMRRDLHPWRRAEAEQIGATLER
jgi:hypothetical protein